VRESWGLEQAQRRNESEGGPRSAVLGLPFLRGGEAPTTRPVRFIGGAESERIRCDPKDGELCLSRTKPEETLVEVRSGSDVQIDRRTRV